MQYTACANENAAEDTEYTMGHTKHLHICLQNMCTAVQGGM